jgi:anti-sigma factor RsiW
MTEPTPLELMQYADGELSPEHAERVAAFLEGSEKPRRRVDGIEQIGAFVRASFEQRLGTLDVTADVMAAIEGESARVGTGDSAAGSESPSSSRRRALWSLVVGGMAAAAAASLWLTRPTELISSPSASRTTASAPQPQAPVAAADDESEVGASVETLDPGPSEATLFVVQAGVDVTPVVWLLDEGDEASDRMEPL